jgi:hypothetical protein
MSLLIYNIYYKNKIKSQMKSLFNFHNKFNKKLLNKGYFKIIDIKIYKV